MNSIWWEATNGSVSEIVMFKVIVTLNAKTEMAFDYKNLWKGASNFHALMWNENIATG